MRFGAAKKRVQASGIKLVNKVSDRNPATLFKQGPEVFAGELLDSESVAGVGLELVGKTVREEAGKFVK